MHYLEAAGRQMTGSTALVSPAWLSANLSACTVLDATWHMPAANRDPRLEHKNGPRIPGSRHFNVDDISDKSSTLPHMLPPAREFAAHMARLGVSHSRPVVVYDSYGLFSAARVWWTLKAFGHPLTAVLDGGLPAWTAAGYPLETGELSGSDGASSAPPVPEEQWTLDGGMVRDISQMLANVAAWESGLPTRDLVADARPLGRYTGDAPEPRPGLPSGHIPHSRSVPFATLLDPTDHNRLLPEGELRKVLSSAGVPVDYASGKLVTSCGSGVTASIIYLALAMCGRPLSETALYDGAWTEYGAHPSAPKATGPPS